MADTFSMAAGSTTTTRKKAIGWAIALSVLMIVAGVLAMVVPPAAGITVTLFVGWLLVFSGITHFVYAFHRRRVGKIVWEVLIGILYTLAGIYLVLNPVMGLTSLTLALSIYLIMEAVLEFGLSFQLRPLPGWGWILMDGIVTLVLAIMIWSSWPASSLWAIGLLVGISMMFSGIARLMNCMATRSLDEAASSLPA
jgi:uncharacterized membrane protein HdeD (DUF308 family)